MPTVSARRSFLLICVCAAALGAAHLVRPTLAWAHARLKKSEPSAGSVSTTVPREIHLWFTEKPELALTKVSLADSAGRPVAVDAPVADKAGTMAVRVPITGALYTGRYMVTWSTAGVDGHPLQGTFGFRLALPGSVAAPAVESVPDVNVLDSVVVAKPTVNSASAVAVRTLSFIALIAIIGAVAFRYAVLPRVATLSTCDQDTIGASAARTAAVAAAVFLVVAVVRLYLQGNMMSTGAGEMRVVAMDTEWGAAWRLQVGGAVLALIGFLIARSRVAVGWGVAAFGTLLLAVATSAGGHAAAAESARSLSLAADTVHIIGAGGWVGSLFYLVSVGLRWATTTADGRGRRVAALVAAFSPAALSFAAVLVVAGMVSAWLRLGSLTALWSSPYGVMLIRKLVMVAFVAGAGAFNWKRVLPMLGSDESVARITRSGTIELALGVVVVVMTAVLVGMPTPVM